MKRQRKPRAIASAFAPVRRLAMMVMLLAFAFQAYAVQTHLHGKPFAAAPVQLLKAPAKPLPADPLDPATCKLCQELVHAGAAISPGGPAFAVLLDWSTVAVPPALLPAATTAARTGWQSRAPPKA